MLAVIVSSVVAPVLKLALNSETQLLAIKAIKTRGLQFLIKSLKSEKINVLGVRL